MGTTHLIAHLRPQVDHTHHLIVTESVIVHDHNVHGEFRSLQGVDVKLKWFIEDGHQSVLLDWRTPLGNTFSTMK